MELVLNRILKGNEYTIGELYIDGIYQCDTLEDRVRPLPKVCPNTSKGISCTCKEKVYGNTAIPAGTYKIVLSYSNRFKKVMPELLDVPHFLGIRIHSLNYPSETDGCIGVGVWDERSPGILKDSRKTYNTLLDLLKNYSDKKEEIILTIKN